MPPPTNLYDALKFGVQSLSEKIASVFYSLPVLGPPPSPAPYAPKYRWDVWVRRFVYGGGAEFWIQAKYGKSPSAPLTGKELCAWLTISLLGMQLKIPGTAATYFTVGDNPYIQISAWDESYTWPTLYLKGFYSNVFPQLCVSSAVGDDGSRGQPWTQLSRGHDGTVYFKLASGEASQSIWTYGNAPTQRPPGVGYPASSSFGGGPWWVWRVKTGPATPWLEKCRFSNALGQWICSDAIPTPPMPPSNAPWTMTSASTSSNAIGPPPMWLGRDYLSSLSPQGGIPGLGGAVPSDRRGDWRP